MGLLFPECFKTTPVASHYNSPQTTTTTRKNFKDSRTSSSSSSKTLVDFSNSSDDEDELEESNGIFISKKIYQTLNNQYIVTSFIKKDEKDEDEIYEDNTDTEDDFPLPPPPPPPLSRSSQLQTIQDFTSSNFTTSNNNRLYTLFACRKCHNHICISNLIISNNFQGRSGELFLVSNIINSKLGLLEKKQMLTGSYEVCDVNCKQCGEYLGWKYLKAESRREKYKVGKYVIEKLLFDEMNVLGG